MAQYFCINPITPQMRLIQQAVEIIRQGGVIAYPTDSSYAFGCSLGNKQAMQRIRQIRQLQEQHNFTLVCDSLAEISRYAQVDNTVYRLLKRFTPGPYTFILKATPEVPRRLQTPKRRTIGLRIADFAIVSALLQTLGEPLISSTLILPGDSLPLNDAAEIRRLLEPNIELVIDGGPCDIQPTSVVDLTAEQPQILRRGKGVLDSFE